MPEKRSRFVLLCQQLLVVGTVLAVAAPAASVVTLDIVTPTPASPAGTAAATAPVALVASEPVAPEVGETPIRGVEESGLEALDDGDPADIETPADGDELAALTAPEPVEGYATVGVTWAPREHVEEDEISVQVRSLDDGTWSDWEPVEYHDDHGPDPDSAEARNARPGTDPILVGDVDEVQVKIETPDGTLPQGARLAVVDPGATTGARLEEPAIDTAALGDDGDAATLSAATTAEPGTDPAPDPGPDPAPDPGTDPAPDPVEPGTDTGTLTGMPAYVTPKPQIFSRAQWGADERLRDKGSLRYYEVHAGFVHHTVNANNYTRDQVPSLLRGIYAYHTRSKGWSDIGYNFVVDRFGRIWEGRYGGVDRPVVGAHTLNYNDYSFAMSALGNFDTVAPPPAMLQAYGRLFAWKLSLHGVSASSPAQRVGARSFPAINGHRDAGQTACPGRYLYAKLGRIRRLASAYQKPFAARTRTTNLAGSPWPDLVVRNKANQKAYVIRTGGQVGFRPGRIAARGWRGLDLVAPAGDFTGDGIPDMVGRMRKTKIAGIFPGTGKGTFGASVSSTRRFAGVDQLAGGVDLTGDRRPDLVARLATTKRLFVFPGNGRGGYLRRRPIANGWGGYSATAGAGDMTGDGRDDLLVREGPRVYLVPGTGRGLAPRVALPYRWGAYDLVTAGGDLTGDGKPDVVARARRSQLAYIFPGDGAGRVTAPLGPFTGFRGLNVITPNGNLAGSAHTDLVARDGNGRMLVVAHNGGRNIEAVTNAGVSFAGTNLILNVGDWNADGRGDVITRAANGMLQLRLGNGGGRFAAPVGMGAGWGTVGLVAAVGDITGDGFPDLMGQPRGGAMRIYPGNGQKGFRPSFVAHSSVSSTGQTGIGLWNADGSPDSVMRRNDGSIMLYPGNGPGGLLSPTKIGAGTAGYDWLQAVGDANGDGRPDLIGREKATGVLWLIPGLHRGFGPRRFIAGGLGAYDLSS